MRQVVDGDQFDELVREAKKGNKKLFSNCYLFSDELDRLARSGRLCYQTADGVLLFFLDEGNYYHLYVYMDEHREFPQLCLPRGEECESCSDPVRREKCGDRDLVFEYSCRPGKASPQSELVRERLLKAGFVPHKASRKLQASLQSAGGKGNPQDCTGPARSEDPVNTAIWKEQSSDALRRVAEQEFSARTAEQEHLSGIYALWDEVSDKYDFVYEDKEELPEAVSGGMVQVVLAPGGDVAAAALMKIKNGVCSVWHVATRPCFRQRGLARALLVRCMEKGMDCRARTAIVWVDQENTAANRLYESLGFVPGGKLSVQLVRCGLDLMAGLADE